jgi:nucleotidyltransferase/DNA polymerase involved in DNA repair
MVAAASREARKCGVRAGMPLAQAALRCPDAAFLDGALDEGFAAAHRVDELVCRETPDIEWESIDEVFVGLPDSLGPTRAIAVAEGLHRSIAGLGFDVSCGVARSKLVARIASQLGRPRGVVHVLDGYEARFLSPLKIEMLPGVDLMLARKLRTAGIRRLGQLARLSEEQLTSLVGRTGASLRRQAAGIDASRIKRTALPPARIKESELAGATADPATLAAAIRREADRIGHDLRSRGVFARSLSLRLRFADGRVDSRTAPLPEPTALDEALFAAAAELLPRMWPGDRLVRAIGVSCSGLIAGSGELFALTRERF